MNVEAELFRAKALLDAGDYPEAHRVCERILRWNPHVPTALGILGMCCVRTEQYGVGYHIFQRLREYSDDPAIWHNIANCLSVENPEALDEAAEWLEKSIEAGGNIALSLSNLACVYTNKREPDKAIHYAEMALKVDPNCFTAKWHASLALLMKREWEKGWEWYDETIGTKLRPALLNFSDSGQTPMWDGEGGTVVVSSEQGLGDEIMFASILPDAVEAAETVIVQCDPRLVNIYRRSFPRAIVAARRKDGTIRLPEPKEITHTIPIGSLGRLFRKKDSDFPGTPYLKPDPERCIQWRALLDTLPNERIVGINWRGGIQETGEDRRSLDLEQLLPVLRLQGVSFVSLNHRPGAEEEIERFERAHGVRIHHWDRALRTDDYDDTAALVRCLNMVVTVTSTVAHLCGALGVPAKVLVPAKPQWRYGLAGARMPWYRSVEMRRQPADGDWTSPVMRIAGELNGAR